MGVSTDAQICYGIDYEEEYEFPWGTYDDEYEGDIEEWWVYLNRPDLKKWLDTLYDEDGNHTDKWDKEWDEYWKEKKKFLDKYPLPVEVVTHCSCDYPMHILAIPGTLITAWRGDVQYFSPRDLDMAEEQEILDKEEDFWNFIETYCPTDKPLQWCLTSLWC